ncbi:MAG: hemolysin [Candidatus Aenigmatarchaeota archaeon]|nr:MAG: hemolysin [Candidatus Aenigmarchaeota archaeon]
MQEFLTLLLLILVALSAFFSGVETAVMSVSLIKAKSLVKQKKRGAKSLLRIKENPHRFLITILVGNNLVNIFAASIATLVFTRMFGSTGVGIATGIMTFLILVFGEITPKTFATQNAERISLLVARPIEVLSYVLFPVVKILEGLTSFLHRFGSKEGLTEEEIRTIVSMGYEEGILKKDIARMMHSLLEFEDIRVEEVMTPKTDMMFVNADSKLKDVIDYIIKSPYSRHPAYSRNKDNIVGILDIDDVVDYIKKKRLGIKVRDIAREVYFVPETKKINELLTEFQKRKTRMAIVVNEYGSVLGLVTMEDVLEEIVGEIFDKSQRKNHYIKKPEKNVFLVDGRTDVEHIEKTIGIKIDEEHFNTIAGFVEHKLGRIPKKGEKIDLGKIMIIIEKANKQRIEKIKIIKK